VICSILAARAFMAARVWSCRRAAEGKLQALLNGMEPKPSAVLPARDSRVSFTWSSVMLRTSALPAWIGIRQANSSAAVERFLMRTSVDRVCA
jgi:hypothetical protein